MGKVFLGILVLVVGLGAAGYANYERNAPLDEELRDRPYKALSEDDLNALASAYQKELDGLSGRLKATAGDKTGIMDGYAPADFDGKVKAFESFQRKNNSWRDTNRLRLEHEGELEKIEKERRIRSEGLDDETTRILRRVLTF